MTFAAAPFGAVAFAGSPSAVVADDTVTLSWPVEIVAQSYAAVPWPVEIVPPTYVTLSWPVAVVSPTYVALDWPVEIVPPTYVTLGWSVQVVSPSYATVTWPVIITAAPQTTVTLPWPVTIATPYAASVGWPVAVIAATAVGGLNGASGWPAAPDGKWMPVVTISGAVVAQLVGRVTVQHADNEARTATFSFLPAAPLQPMSLTGRPVQIAFAQRNAAGVPINAQTMFTGVVETPTIDLITGVVSCECHDQMQEIINNIPRATLDVEIGGRHHEAVTGAPADNWDYVQAQLESVPKSVALDALQRLRVMPWRGAGLATATVRDADMLAGSLSVDLPSRDQIRTRITCRMEYRYERLRGRGAVCAYSQPIRFYIGDLRFGGASRINGVTWLTVAMVDSAIGGFAGWNVKGSVAYDQPASGTYMLGLTTEDGFYIIPPDVAPNLTMGFSSVITAQWTQTVTETYSVTVVNHALEAVVGPVPEEIGATLAAEFSQDGWGADPSVTPVLTIPTAADVIQPWQPVGYDTPTRDHILHTLLDQAWTRLDDSTRTGRVRFDLPLRPDMWLDWWLTIETARLRATGKVAEIEHDMDADGGSAITSIGVAVGMPGETTASLPTWTLPAVPATDDDRPLSAYSCTIGTFVGGGGGTTLAPPQSDHARTSPPFDDETMIGFVTNLELGSQGSPYNWYPHQLKIKTPDIDAIDRDPITLDVTETINVDIPTDALEIL